MIHLENSTVILDGTFKYCPRGFTQLYTLVVFINGAYIPLVFVLMKRKNESSYNRVIEFLKYKVPNFIPEMLIFDFESAPQKVFKMAYNGATIYGCLFHFSQNIWRKIQELKLSNYYKENSVFKWKKNY